MAPPQAIQLCLERETPAEHPLPSYRQRQWKIVANLARFQCEGRDETRWSEEWRAD